MTTAHQSDIEHPGSGACRRKAVPAGESAAPPVEVIDGVWHVRSLPLVREVLRAGTTTQAGFNSEAVQSRRIRPPILFRDGAGHRAQRSAIARYFAPKTVTARYRTMMERRADELVARVLVAGRVDLPDLALRYSVEVAAQVVGLTNSDMAGMARRLEAFFATPRVAPTSDARPADRVGSALMSLRSQASMLAFFLRDVRPAIKARRKTPGDDVISHLIGEGYKAPEILIECITYGAAGMVTTREFISMATWHLLEDPPLLQRFLKAEYPERRAILEEILRLEPIVGHLYRRSTTPLELVHDGNSYAVPAGALLDLYIRAANADPGYVGPDPLDLCPMRPVAKPYQAEVMSFGDGAHRCPGNSLAMEETDILLTRLLQLPLRVSRAPRIAWEDLIAGYEVRDFELIID